MLQKHSNLSLLVVIHDGNMKTLKNGKCKHGCGKPYATGHYECKGWRTKLRHLAKKKKALEQPSEGDHLKIEVTRPGNTLAVGSRKRVELKYTMFA